MGDYMHITPLSKCPKTKEKLTEEQVTWNEVVEQLKKESEDGFTRGLQGDK